MEPHSVPVEVVENSNTELIALSVVRLGTFSSAKQNVKLTCRHVGKFNLPSGMRPVDTVVPFA